MPPAEVRICVGEAKVRVTQDHSPRQICRTSSFRSWRFQVLFPGVLMEAGDERARARVCVSVCVSVCVCARARM